nr:MULTISPECIES: GntR family transcriptional regulator [unclassified Streptomyces]
MAGSSAGRERARPGGPGGGPGHGSGGERPDGTGSGGGREDSSGCERPDGAERAGAPERTSLSARARDAIRQRIADRTYPQGARLVEREVAEELRMSRVPVREALRALVGEGLLELLPHSGVRVRRLDRADVEHLYEVREPLAVRASRLAARRVARSAPVEPDPAGRPRGRRRPGGHLRRGGPGRTVGLRRARRVGWALRTATTGAARLLGFTGTAGRLTRATRAMSWWWTAIRRPTPAC